MKFICVFVFFCVFSAFFLFLCFFVSLCLCVFSLFVFAFFDFVFMCTVRPSTSSLWHTTRRHRNHNHNRFVQPPSPPIINLTEDSELVRHLRASNDMPPPPPPPPLSPIASTSRASTSTSMAETSASLPVATGSAAEATTSEAMTTEALTAAVQTEAATAAAMGMEEERNELAPSREPDRLTNSLSYAYFAFIKLYREEKAHENLGAINRVVNEKHAKMMAKIDRHFFDLTPFRLLDPEVLEYVSLLNMNVLDSWDRQKVLFYKIEMDRIRFSTRHQAQFRLRKAKEHRLICTICLKQYSPNLEVSLLECGHMFCLDCVNQIYDTPTIKNDCGRCRSPMGQQIKHVKVFFMFNYFLDVICRFCEAPFNSDDSCYAYECGHLYHSKCLSVNKLVCLPCGRPILKKPCRVYLDFQ